MAKDKKVEIDTESKDYVLNNREACLHYLKNFKSARNKLQADAENVEPTILAIEELGRALTPGTANGMNDYLRGYLFLIPKNRSSYKEFSRLYEKVRKNRNDYVHQGASVRSFGEQASKLANLIVTELMEMVDPPLVKDLMVEHVIIAKSWHSLRKVRHFMLAHGFTAIPYFVEEHGRSSWTLITDYNLLRTYSNKADLEKTCKDSFNEDLDLLEDVEPIFLDQVARNVRFDSGLPKLVFRTVGEVEELVGIISPSDVL